MQVAQEEACLILTDLEMQVSYLIDEVTVSGHRGVPEATVNLVSYFG